jgi:hypothetical protein
VQILSGISGCSLMIEPQGQGGRRAGRVLLNFSFTTM